MLVEEGVAALLVEEEVLEVAGWFWFLGVEEGGVEGERERRREREGEKAQKRQNHFKTYVLSISATCSWSASHSAVSAMVV